MPAEYVFGPFRLIPSRRLLLEGNRALELGSRAFDVLVHLVQRRGALVSNTELMASVWPNTVVDVGSLRVHMSALRKALGDEGMGHRYVINVPLMGYRFVAPVVETDSSPSPDPSIGDERAQPISANMASVPPQLSRVVGRDQIVGELEQATSFRRCITIVGPGGIGKTTVATMLARRLAQAHGYPVVFVPLAAAADSRHALFAVASALDVPTGEGQTVQSILNLVRQRRMLLVFDNCEQVIDTMAELVEQAVRTAPKLHIIATSREPLRIDGEWVFRLDSLEVPSNTQPMTVAQAKAYPAVELFVERATSCSDIFSLDDGNVAIVCDICRRLDGIPLAIELAAASIDSIGLMELREGLSSRLSLLTRGRRTALARHQTLQATLDWSHDLLSESERTMLRRVSVFVSAFTVEAAVAVLGGTTNPAQVLLATDTLSGLVDKSLLVADVLRDPVEYHLLETTRAYGLQKLSETTEEMPFGRHHARYFDESMACRPPEADPEALTRWIKTHVRRIADIRAAIEWAFANDEAAIAVRLTANSAALWFELSLVAEFRALAERALDAVRLGTPVEDAAEMRLWEALGHALWHTQGDSVAMKAAFSRSLELAEKLRSTDLQFRSIWGLWLISNSQGSYDRSISLARRFGSILSEAKRWRRDLTYLRMMALGLHLQGKQSRSLAYARRVLEHPVTVNHPARNSGFQFDQRVAALTVLARSLWVNGHPEQALAHATTACEEGLRLGHSLSLCYALANGAVPVALWCERVDEAARFNSLLLAHATEHSLHFWRTFALLYRRALERAGAGMDPSKGPPERSDSAPSVLLLETVATLDSSLADPITLERANRRTPSWCLPELIRILVTRLAPTDALACDHERNLREAIQIARRQRALSWELRCGVTLAEHFVATDRVSEAHATLESIMSRMKLDELGYFGTRARALLSG